MKNKKYVYVICFALLVVIIAGGIIYLTRPMIKNGNLNINGKMIYDENIVIRRSDADLPLIEVLEALNFNIKWADSNIADVNYKGKKYVLNLKEVSLYDEEQDLNLLIIPPGSSTYNYKILERELIIESNIIKSAMYLINRDINIQVDYDDSVVYITEVKDE